MSINCMMLFTEYLRKLKILLDTKGMHRFILSKCCRGASKAVLELSMSCPYRAGHSSSLVMLGDVYLFLGNKIFPLHTGEYPSLNQLFETSQEKCCDRNEPHFIILIYQFSERAVHNNLTLEFQKDQNPLLVAYLT